MKLQLSFDMTSLEEAITIAQQVEEYIDIFEVGSLLLYSQGIQAVKEFRERFPNKTLLADAKIVDRAHALSNLFFKEGANWVTVMAGTSDGVIAEACKTGTGDHKYVMLDLIDSYSIAQSALDAERLGVDALLFHLPHDNTLNQKDFFIDNWELVRENTKLPIFIAPRKEIDNIIPLIKEKKPDGLIIGSAICKADNPVDAAKKFAELKKL